MGKYEEKIADSSLWITATPTQLAKTLPFFISEAGHFIADYDYKVQRNRHDSFLLLYTVSGQGSVQTGENTIPLSRGHAVIIDCHIPHEYHSVSDKWEFLWIHFNGNGAASLFPILYQNNTVRAVRMSNAEEFEKRMNSLINEARKNDISAYLHLSSDMHALFNTMYLAMQEKDKADFAHSDTNDIRAAVTYIEKNYFRQITIDDMIQDLPISKYHFIRRFGRSMGITPYSYLTNYRINVSKTLLRTTDKTVSEIAESCGFLDTSNFITHFKKHTGQKPLQYRRDFSYRNDLRII